MTAKEIEQMYRDIHYVASERKEMQRKREERLKIAIEAMKILIQTEVSRNQHAAGTIAIQAFAYADAMMAIAENKV